MLRFLVRFFVYGLLAAGGAAEAQQMREYESGSAAGPCRIREPAGRDSWRFLWTGRCLNGYAHGDGTLRVRKPDAATIEKGQFVSGLRQGLWETYSRANTGDGEITNYLSQYEHGIESRDAPNLGGVRVVKQRDLAAWAEPITRINYADTIPAHAPVAQPPAAPKAAAKKPAPAVAAAAPALPALGAGYKGHLYVLRFDLSDAKGTSGDFMSYVAPDRASAQRLYDEYVSGQNSLTQSGKPALLSIDECDGRGAGPYFALAVAHDTRDGSAGGGGWVCGAASPDAAARAALESCKQCRPRPEAQVYLLVSTHAAGGSSQVQEVATFGATSGASTRVWNNYDYSGCLWVSGTLAAAGPDNTLRVDCRAYF